MGYGRAETLPLGVPLYKQAIYDEVCQCVFPTRIEDTEKQNWCLFPLYWA